MEFGFESLTLADDSDSLTLDWGDGSVETITETVRERTHTYAAAGLHIIRLSDDVRALQVTGDYDPTYAFARYRLLPVAFRSTATRLTSLGSMALARIRFAAANEAAIKATSSYQADPTLGSVNAAVTFDL